MSTALHEKRFEQTYLELQHARPELFAASKARLAELREETRHAQDARRFGLWTGTPGPLGYRGSWSKPIDRHELVRALNRLGLERCLKRDASHLLQVAEYLPDGTSKVRLECWVGSYPDIKLTDWQKEYSRLAFPR